MAILSRDRKGAEAVTYLIAFACCERRGGGRPPGLPGEIGLSVGQTSWSARVPLDPLERSSPGQASWPAARGFSRTAWTSRRTSWTEVVDWQYWERYRRSARTHVHAVVEGDARPVPEPAEPGGRGSKAMGTPWKYAMVMEERARIGRASLRSR